MRIFHLVNNKFIYIESRLRYKSYPNKANGRNSAHRKAINRGRVMTAFEQCSFIRSLLISTSMLGMLGGSALAQQAASVPAEDDSLQDIIVYAQRKATGETVQSVPVAVMAISGQTLNDQHIQDLTEIGRLMPNVDLQPAGTLPLVPSFNIPWADR
jgi:hypothetical protein